MSVESNLRSYADLRVEAAVVHLVNPRVGRLALSQAELALDDGVGDFLRTHVRRGLDDARASAARFLAGSAAGELCRKMLASRASFVAHSVRLARRLYGSSEDDQRISDGTLAVVRLASDRGRLVALLKLDPLDGYRAVETEDAKGRARIQLVLEPDILPSVRERLQKCAFVRAPEGDDYPMLVVDQQRPGETVSDFFLHRFLEAELVLDAPARTRALYRVLTNAKNEVTAELPSDAAAQLDQYLDGQVVSDRVNVDQLVAGLPVEPRIRDRFRERLDDELPDRDFELDPPTARKFVKQKRFEGDNNLRLTVPSEFYEEMVTEQRPGPDGYWTIRIRTRRWRQSQT
ncbi:MAG: nucleoid-associated protein [Sandaracinaceae bacterium]